MIAYEQPPKAIISAPLLRWVGSKSRMTHVLRAALPSGRRLIEPFVGSGSVFLGTRYPAYLLGDRNSDLVNLYRWVQKDVERFLRFARPLFLGSYPDEEAYERTRSAFNKASRNSLERAILFLWLNKTCFNGVCRYNSSGEFNVPKGSRTGPLPFPEEDIRLFHRKSMIAEFLNEDFRALLDMAGPGDVVYCDPPYVPRSTTASFTRYTKEDFTLDDQFALADACRKATARGAVVVVSNSDTPLSREIYAGSLLVSGRLTHMVGAQGDARTTVGEALFLFGDAGASDFWTMGKRLPSPHSPSEVESCYTREMRELASSP
jgi:DNA adenine methylase